MKAKFLEDMGLAKEQIAKIIAENNIDVENASIEGSQAKSQLITLEASAAALKTQLSERDSQLEALKNSSENPEILKETIATLQAENKTKDEAHVAEIKSLKIESAVEAALLSSGAKNSKAVRALLDIDPEKIKVKEDGALEGLTLSDQLEKLQSAADSKFMFEVKNNKPFFRGAKAGESGNEPPDGAVKISNMTYEEICAMEAQ